MSVSARIRWGLAAPIRFIPLVAGVLALLAAGCSKQEAPDQNPTVGVQVAGAVSQSIERKVVADATGNVTAWYFNVSDPEGNFETYWFPTYPQVYYDSNQAGTRDQFPDNSNDKYVTAMIAKGKVYVGTPNAVVVFGLLP